MARLTPLWGAPVLTAAPAIQAFLAERGVRFETWELPPEVRRIAARDRLDDDDRARLLALFRAELERESAGAPRAIEADVVALRPDLPGLEDALARFDRVHCHRDDEIRAIVGGRGVFGFVGDDGRQFLLAMEPGEFISVPGGVWHWFYLDEERNITALRLFEDPAGWVARYRDTSRGETA